MRMFFGNGLSLPFSARNSTRFDSHAQLWLVGDLDGWNSGIGSEKTNALGE